MNSRTLIEQAKGVLYGQTGLSVDEAFRLMREHSRRHRIPLRDIAGQVITGAITVEQLLVM